MSRQYSWQAWFVVVVALVLATTGTTWAADATWSIATGTAWTTNEAWNTGSFPGISGPLGYFGTSLDVATFESIPSSPVTYNLDPVDDNLNVGGIVVNTSASGTLAFQTTSRMYFTAGGRGIELTSSVTAPVTFQATGISSGASGTVSFINNATANTATLTFLGGHSFISAAPNGVLELGGINTGSNNLAGNVGAAGGTTLSLRKTGNSFWIIGGGNGQLRGGVVIESGTLGLNTFPGAQPLGTGTVTINGGALAGVGASNRGLFNTVRLNADVTLGGLGHALTLFGDIDLGGGTRTITLPDSATFDNTLFAGKTISNGGMIINANPSGTPRTLTINGSNSYAGGTTIASGTLAAGASAASASAFGTGTITVAAGAAFNLNSQAVANVIANQGGSLFNAASFAGRQTLTGTSTFGALGGDLDVATGGVATLQALASGSITVDSGGRLVLAATGTAGGAVLVHAGGFLGGTGRVNGGLTVAGTLSPGSSPGLLSTSLLTLESTANTLIEITGTTRGTGYDGINVSTAGGMTYGGQLSLSFSGTFADDTAFSIFNFSGAASGGLSSVIATGAYGSRTFTELGSTGVWEVAVTNGQGLRFTESTGFLSIYAVPEPATWCLALGGLACGGCLVRRRRRT